MSTAVAALARPVALLLAVATVLAPCRADVVQASLDLTHAFAYPDGFYRRIVRANGEFPGPAIRVRRGDVLTVEVTNRLVGHATTVHWHGFEQRGTPWMDGVSGGTQCQIGTTPFVYNFTVTATPGTYFWHGHNAGLRMDGLYGALIVEDEKEDVEWDGELTVALQDWYHNDSTALLVGLDGPFESGEPFTRMWKGDPDSILVNGRAEADCDRVAEKAFPPWQCRPDLAGPAVLNVEAGKRYLLRIINAASLSFLNFAVQGHSLRVVRVDGSWVDPIEVDSLDINVAQKVDAILVADQPVANYWAQATVRFRKLVSGRAVLRYQGAKGGQPADAEFDNPMPTNGEPFDPRDLRWDEAKNGPIPAWVGRAAPDVTIPIKTTQEVVEGPDGVAPLRWLANGKTFRNPDDGTPILHRAWAGALDDLDENVTLFTVPGGGVVDIVFQNSAARNLVVEQHPWHVHGHHFFVLGYGPGKFDREQHGDLLNLVDPPRMDTVTLYPLLDGLPLSFDGSSGTSPKGEERGEEAGWSVVRFMADNPGVWLLHCHQAAHLHMGLALFMVDQAEAIPDPPEGLPDCGIMEELEAAKRAAEGGG
eukprot:evm.model.scf_2454.2 EVM.evm.TU.scf_2454.2   scf_2454:10290-12062(-)